MVGVLAAGALKVAAGYAVSTAMASYAAAHGGDVAAGSWVAGLQSFVASSLLGPAGIAFAVGGAVVGPMACSGSADESYYWECLAN